MKKKQVHYRKVYNNRLYTAKTLQQCLSVTPSAISYYIRCGLRPINPGERPLIFEGATVKIFLKQRSMARKIKLLPGEFYCLSCRAGRKAHSASIEIIDSGKTLGKGSTRKLFIRGKCTKCGHRINLVWSSVRLSEFVKCYPDLEKHGVKLKFNTNSA